MRICLNLASFLFLFSGAIFAQLPQVSASQGYTIGPGDVISIKALGEPSFDVEALTVDEDGNIMIPYSDVPLVAKCKTERGLQAEVVQVWSKYLKKPQISLRVTQRNSRPPVSVYGEVRGQAQQFNLTRRVHLLELISYAGGIDTEKSNGMIQVFRPRPPMCGESDLANSWTVGTDSGLNAPSKIFNYSSLSQGDAASNPEILAGDIIVVAKSSPIYVIGEVMKPGEINIPEGGLHLTQAIAMASGQTREAKLKSVKILRRKPGAAKPDEIIANLENIKKGTESDIMLEPFDIVEVGKAPKRFLDYVVEFATGIPNRIPIRPI
ncbi:MAG TPA: polysaccharide biosynthesis/export family protein [Pyrinomonadaceae bacterium]|nr:polysaccharide biosynthesis/export family protein [Pyrinomonadaceae bacterium]